MAAKLGHQVGSRAHPWNLGGGAPHYWDIGEVALAWGSGPRQETWSLGAAEAAPGKDCSLPRRKPCPLAGFGCACLL